MATPRVEDGEEFGKQHQPMDDHGDANDLNEQASRFRRNGQCRRQAKDVQNRQDQAGTRDESRG